MLCPQVVCSREAVDVRILEDFPTNEKFILVGTFCHVCIICMEDVREIKVKHFNLPLGVTDKIMSYVRDCERLYKPPEQNSKPRFIVNALKNTPIPHELFKFAVNQNVLSRRYVIPDKFANAMEKIGYEFGGSSAFMRRSEMYYILKNMFGNA